MQTFSGRRGRETRLQAEFSARRPVEPGQRAGAKKRGGYVAKHGSLTRPASMPATGFFFLQRLLSLTTSVS
jgi:hypothetical protein